MARPRLGEEERRTRTVGVRVTEAEETELRERAQVLYFTLFRQNSSDYSDARPRNFVD